MTIPVRPSVRVYAIASLLNPAADRATHELWQRLDSECGLRGIRLTPTPHFSWQGAQAYMHPEVLEVLSQLVKGISPFRVRTTGLGIFTAAYPILYLPLVKNRQMVEFHEQIWRLVTPYASEPNPYYDPDHWMPHITLANRDVTPEKLTCAVRGLLHKTLEFEIVVDHLVMIYSIGDELGMLGRYDFGRKNGGYR